MNGVKLSARVLCPSRVVGARDAQKNAQKRRFVQPERSRQRRKNDRNRSPAKSLINLKGWFLEIRRVRGYIAPVGSQARNGQSKTQ